MTSAPAQKLSILVVDDQADVREFLRDALCDEFEVVTAASGHAALKLLQVGGVRPHVAVVDIIMPDKDGIETIRELKQLQPSLKIIAMSGGGRVVRIDMLEIAQQLGAESIMRKPIEATAVREMVRTLAA